jgi:hypothetical protein
MGIVLNSMRLGKVPRQKAVIGGLSEGLKLREEKRLPL